MIDDDISMMNLLSVFIAKYNHKLIPYTEPISAIEKLKEEHFDILIVNYIMSPVNGDKIVELVRQFNKDIYIIMLSTNKELIPSMDILHSLDIQAYYEKSSRFGQLILGIESAVKYSAQIKKIKDINERLDKQTIDFAKVLLNTVDAKDRYTGQHSIRVCEYCLRLGKALDLPSEDIEILRLAGLFHDIGKIGVPDSILTKASNLTNDEYEIVKYHPVIGANILSVSSIFRNVSDTIIAHHERLDGKGYPYGITENQIPFLSKILSICDAFDAITTRRSYKETGTIEFAISELENAKGTQLDPELTDRFISLIKADLNNFLILKDE